MKRRDKKFSFHGKSRRDFLRAASGIAAVALAPLTATTATAQSLAPPSAPGRRAQAAAMAMQVAIGKVVGAAQVNKGKVKLELPELVDNGNAVPLAIKVDSPMSQTDYVKVIHVFSERNPLPEVASFHLGPRSGRASVATRIRLADTQTIVAICQMNDGSFWSGSADAVVTLPACAEDN